MNEQFELLEQPGESRTGFPDDRSRWLRAALTAGLVVPFVGFVLFVALKLGGALPVSWQVEDVREFDE